MKKSFRLFVVVCIGLVYLVSLATAAGETTGAATYNMSWGQSIVLGIV